MEGAGWEAVGTGWNPERSKQDPCTSLCWGQHGATALVAKSQPASLTGRGRLPVTPCGPARGQGRVWAGPLDSILQSAR